MLTLNLNHTEDFKTHSCKNLVFAVIVGAEVVDDEEPSLGEFLNHTGPVHGLQVHEGRLYTCSGDNTARAYGLVVC